MDPKLATPTVPGVPAGSPPTGSVEQSHAPDPGPRLPVPSSVAAESVPLFGGKRGGKARLDGLVPGSDEAKEADRKKNAERMRLARERERAEQTPQRLSPVAASAESPGVQTIPVVDLAGGSAIVGWLPEDFKQVAPDTIDVIEQWRIQDKIELAESGKLSPPVVAKIAKDAAFPPASKKSLQGSCPEALAKIFNACNVPVALKAYISTAPTAVYLIVRDLQQRSEIRKLVQAERETFKREQTTDEPKKSGS
jgi:hypothetical protein